ncbi:MAG TPA: TlpA disulfide reductase family protein [Mycobacteriales bacterium]|nr:TlpA disulfide reductase family protein [Mycobacteriales bacterium]
MRLADRSGAVRLLLAATLLAAPLAACEGDGGSSDSARSCSGSQVADGSATVVPERERCPAPTLRGSTLDGEPFDVADLRGSVVVLNVWGSWCAPCKKEQPELQRAADDLAADGVRFVGINVRDRTTGNALAHNRRYAVTYPSLFDPSAKLVARFRDLPPSAIPTTVVLDREGRIAARVLGATSYAELVDLARRVA